MLLLVSTTLVGWRTYSVWQTGPWDLPRIGDVKPIFSLDEKQAEASPAPTVGTEIIVGKNVFDPERGAGATREVEVNSRALQRVRGLILIGTIILDNERVAILQEPTGSGPGAPPSNRPAPMRMKVGDAIEGYRLSEISDRKAVFTSGPSRIEILLDYFRKIEVPAPGQAPVARAPVPGQLGTPGAAAAPRVIPNLPRRERVPAPPSQ